MTPAQPPPPPSPGRAGAGWLLDVLDNKRRTDNLMRLLRWLVPAAVLVTIIMSTTVVVIALGSPIAITGLAGGASTATLGGLAWRAHRTRTPKSSPDHELSCDLPTSAPHAVSDSTMSR